MIQRYSRPEMKSIWSQQTKFDIWFQIEAHACDALAKLGKIPQKASKSIWKNGKYSIKRIEQIEKKTKHDVIAFLTNLSENIGPDARFIHQGMTSSDILDTTLSIQLVKSSEILLDGIKTLCREIKKQSLKHKYTPTIGRSHGIHAEPTTFGLKLASFYSEFTRNYNRLKNAKEEISICAISGAIGTFAHIDPYVEKYVALKMGLNIEPISTQIIPRDRHAMFFSTLAVIASSIERFSTEIRHLQRTEVREVEEYFSIGQKGSSAMPHKRNPILTENLTGLSRIVRSSIIPALENVALWHERDISHSSVERMIAPDTTIVLDFAIHRLINVVQNLIIYPEKMRENLNKLNGLIFSQKILLELTNKGLSRESAYKVVQKNALLSWEKNLNFLETLKKDKTIKKYLNDKELNNSFNLEKQLQHVDTIFDRVFN